VKQAKERIVRDDMPMELHRIQSVHCSWRVPRHTTGVLNGTHHSAATSTVSEYLHPEVLLAALWQVAQNRVHRSAGAAVEHVEVSAQPLRAVQIKRVRHNVLRKPRLLEPSFRSVLRDQTHESIQSIVGTVDR
jgi:hypothetical protein